MFTRLFSAPLTCQSLAKYELREYLEEAAQGNEEAQGKKEELVLRMDCVNAASVAHSRFTLSKAALRAYELLNEDGESLEESIHKYGEAGVRSYEPLVRMVRRMGVEACAAEGTRLRIVTLPLDHMGWVVRRSGGSEWLEEKHRRWSPLDAVYAERMAWSDDGSSTDDSSAEDSSAEDNKVKTRLLAERMKPCFDIVLNCGLSRRLGTQKRGVERVMALSEEALGLYSVTGCAVKQPSLVAGNPSWRRLSVRTDPLLIAVVRYLGHRANGNACTNLKVVRVPLDTKPFVIKCNMGFEWVEEVHRIFGRV